MSQVWPIFWFSDFHALGDNLRCQNTWLDQCQAPTCQHISMALKYYVDNDISMNILHSYFCASSNKKVHGFTLLCLPVIVGGVQAFDIFQFYLFNYIFNVCLNGILSANMSVRPNTITPLGARSACKSKSSKQWPQGNAWLQSLESILPCLEVEKNRKVCTCICINPFYDDGQNLSKYYKYLDW